MSKFSKRILLSSDASFGLLILMFIFSRLRNIKAQCSYLISGGLGDLMNMTCNPEDNPLHYKITIWLGKFSTNILTFMFPGLMVDKVDTKGYTLFVLFRKLF